MLGLLVTMNGMTVYKADFQAVSSDALPFITWPTVRHDTHDDSQQPARQSVPTN